ncbi:unnamed protein product [Hyaloperonospora brassicae]|uniref:RxLR effector candidate protein n=1 Tax=Hyaloperonospora brassicae TaxID=162125 RepID=A0AAV0T1F8_HYABA|nr:unnamed protein product [Hyaloperonospora brassicae]
MVASASMSCFCSVSGMRHMILLDKVLEHERRREAHVVRLLRALEHLKQPQHVVGTRGQRRQVRFRALPRLGKGRQRRRERLAQQVEGGIRRHGVRANGFFSIAWRPADARDRNVA